MRRLLVHPQLMLATVMLVIGVVLLLAAGFQATTIPVRAHDDFGALIARQGVMSHAPDYPSVYRRMSADSRMLQNAYLGGGGLILLAAGSFGLMSAVRACWPIDGDPPGGRTRDGAL